MKNGLIFFIAALLSVLCFIACNNTSDNDRSKSLEMNLRIADNFIDAFYSFDKDRLDSLLSHTDHTRIEILYYQKWADCGNYKILKRGESFNKNDSTVICPVTIKDDLIGALNIDFNTTDTFHLIIKNGRIRSITTSSNDPDDYYEAKAWVKENRPELIEIPCIGIFEDGETPCECVLAMIKGFKQYQSEENQNNKP